MKKFLFFFGFLIASTLKLRANVINTADLSYENSNKLNGSHYKNIYGHNDAAISTNAPGGEGIGHVMFNSIGSFLDIVAEKVVDKLENHIERDGVSDKMLVLLQNNAELFDMDNYKDHNLALIQTLFFSKLKEKFLKSKFGQKVKALTGKVKTKLVDLYHKHKDKLKHFFKVLLKGMVLPLFIKFIKKHINRWRANTLSAVKKMEGDSKKIILPVVYKLYDHVEEQINEAAYKHNIEMPEDEAMEEMKKDEEAIEKLENAENKIIKNA